MSNLPFPGFSTLQELRGWASTQAGILLTILADGPAAFLAQLQGPPDVKLAEAVKFFAFIFLLCVIITLPLDYTIWRLDVTDVGSTLSGAILNLIGIILFCVCLHLIARLFRSESEFKSGLTALFFSTAYLPLLVATKYIEGADPAGQQFSLGKLQNDVIIETITSHPILIIAVTVQAALIFYMIYKLVGVVKYTYEFGAIKALTTIIVAGGIHSLIVSYILRPYFIAIVGTGGRP
jgi:hypothetical protein